MSSQPPVRRTSSAGKVGRVTTAGHDAAIDNVDRDPRRSFTRLPLRWVNRHHPECQFARVIYARRSSVPAGPRRTKLQQAEFSRPADRRAALLNAELAIHGALMGLHGIERDVEPRTDLTSR